MDIIPMELEFSFHVNNKTKCFFLEIINFINFIFIGGLHDYELQDL
jgi:hypothetical protein